MYMNVHGSIIHNSQEVKQSKPLSSDEWTKCGIYTHRKRKVKVKSLSRVRLLSTPWTVAYQGPLSMGFSRQEHWNGLPFPSPGDLPEPGIEPGSVRHCRQTLYHLSHQGRLNGILFTHCYMNFENIILSKIIQTQKAIYYRIQFI